MKRLIFATMALVISITTIVSCKKKNDEMNMTMDKTNVNINYPAIYVVNGEDATISVIKSATNEVSETIKLMGSGTDMIMWPHHISLHQNHLAIGVPMMDLSAGHSGLNTSGMTGKLVVVNAENGSILKNISLPKMNHNTIYSPNGTEIWVPQMDATVSKVLVYDAITFGLKNTINMLNLKGFAESYKMYDVVAKQIPIWAYLYAFIELGLGIAYLIDFSPLITNVTTLVVMTISIIGVLQSVLNNKKIQCACLGAVFNLPMSTVTIIEDALMILMSGWMILNLL